MLKRFALSSTALTFLLLSADQAAAGPLIGAVAGVFSAIVSGTGVASAFVSLALAAGTTLLQMATAADKPPPVGMKIQADVGDDQPVSTTIGEFATRGKRKYIGTWGKVGDTPNTYLTEVFELGSLPIPALDGIWIDGEKGTILWNEPDQLYGRGYPIEQFRVPDEDSPGRDHCWVKFYTGAQTAADPFLLATFGNDAKRPWDATMIGRGIPYAIMTYRYHRTFFKAQPKALFEPAPLKLYDLRKDSTNGGNGTHRFEDESTYEPSYNLSVMTYNVIRGLRYKGEWFYGGQNVNARRLPASNWIAAHQEAGRLVERADGSTEPQWRGGYEITGDAAPLTVIEEFRKAQNGRLTDQGGIFKMKNGIFGAPVFSFTDADCLITDPSGFDPFASVDLTINGVNGKYPNPKEAWVAKDAPVVRNAAYEAVDGKRNLADISFGATSHDRQVQQLMRAILAEARRFRRHQIPLPPMAYVLEAGIDVVGWTSPHNGYVNKRFLVVERRGQMGMNQLVTLQEIDPTDYDWVREMQAIVSSGWIGRIDVPAQAMTGWGVEPYEILDVSGRARRPAILVKCAQNLVDVQRVQVQVSHAASGALVFDSDQFPYGTPWQWVVSEGLLPNTDYLVRGRLVPFTARETLWSGAIPVRTPDIRFSADDLHLLDITQAVQADLAQLSDWIWRDTNIRGLIEDRRAIAIGLAQQDLANFADKQQIRREAASSTGALKASFKEEITVATSATAALAKQVVTVQASLAGKASADLVTTTIARVTATEGSISALGADLTTVSAALTDKIGSAVFNGLSSEVSRIGDRVTLQGDMIGQIDLDLDGKASLNALNVLSGTVASQGNAITSQGTLLNSLTAQVGEVSADARFRMEVLNANGTGYALFGGQVRFGTADDYGTAGFFIKKPSDPNQPSSFIVNANLFAISSGDENGSKIFAVDAGGVYVDSAYIRSISTDKITFLDGSVQTSALAQNAATAFYKRTSAGAATYSTTGDKLTGEQSIDVTLIEGDVININGLVRVRQNTAGASSMQLKLYLGNTMVAEDAVDFAQVGPYTYLYVSYDDDAAGAKDVKLILTITSITGTVLRDRYRLTCTHFKRGKVYS